MNMTVEEEFKVGSSETNVEFPSSKGPPGIITASGDRATRYIRENLLIIGLGWEKYAKLHPHPW